MHAGKLGRGTGSMMERKAQLPSRLQTNKNLSKQAKCEKPGNTEDQLSSVSFTRNESSFHAPLLRYWCRPFSILEML